MSPTAPLRRSPFAFAFAFLIIGPMLLAACGSSGKAATSSSTAASATTSTTTSASTSTTTSGPTPTTVSTAGSANPPSSCRAIPVALISPLTGGVATSRSLALRPGQISCEFTNVTASKIVIVNIGRGTAALFAILKTRSAGGGRTITPISGLGAQAFSISQGGVVRGVDAITARGLLVSVAANVTLAQNETLVRQLMNLP